ncbi:phage tail protein [Sphingomonas sp. NFR15]|uniref:phage tail protein n=1 Tax=Sphingomonas sp. NFR15 TaxID=1566282 RepID=UPI000883DAF6|nr:phage tail protein [Sphingomonas sp. NFR15]SDA35244.1 Putative phage tail protein [Sphingomonas sp. NFR15]
MATLVLTTIGSVIGGPIGGAIGAVLGQAVDRDVIFKPKGREGPRLTELAVQTSSYGTPIQQVFGTMRIAGCVIWSTDLIESRSTAGGGKGQPSVTSYSYSASFAVALSGRPIQRVGRIWADGNLLRGAAGDFKVSTGFRLHLGGEDQEADPLIASAEGVALAPAHRGIAYAVFEGLQLADYGNRIPSLTFEVIADPAPVAAGAIAAAVSGGLIDGAAATLPLPGFAAYGNLRGVIETIGVATGGWFAPRGAGLAMRAGGDPERIIADAGFAAGVRGGARSVSAAAAIESVPRMVTLRHYDPARDYQAGVQRARRPGAGQTEQQIDMPAALDADSAKTMAEATLARAEAARVRRTVALGWDAIGIAPGARVAIEGQAGVWRVTGWSLEQMVLSLDCVRLAAAALPARASGGRVLPSPDSVAGTTIVHVFEIPPLDDGVLSAPRVMIAAAGTAPGWRRAALLHSLDGGARWSSAGATAAPATLGMLVSVPLAVPATLRDRRSRFEVELAHAGMVLTGANAGAIDASANLVLCGDELLQFGTAEQIGATRWRLSDLYRGRRGTEAAIGTQAVGDRVVLIERDTLITLDMPLAALGGEIRVLASGVGDVAGPGAARTVIAGISVLPPAPVGLRWRELGGGDAAIAWTRRSRAGWRWLDGVDAPLAEERELYRVTIGTGPSIDTSEPAHTLTAAERATGVSVSIRQIGSAGASAAAALFIPAWEA